MVAVLYLWTVSMAACSEPLPARPLAMHEAYVWQHHWGPAMRAAVEQRPRAIQQLRVLALTWTQQDAPPVPTSVDLIGLAHAGPVTVVARIEGSRLVAGLSLRPLVDLALAWREQGIDVRGLEVDHDCATARVAAYAGWLRAQRPLVGSLPLAITALPDWHRSPHLPALVEAADRVTVQLHAIRAPSLFDAKAARLDCEAWAEATRRPFWIALPTYQVRLRDGPQVSADPQVVAAFVESLRQNPVPGLEGAAWFRLGHAGDEDAWPGATLAAVMTGLPLRGEVNVELRAAGTGLWDIVAHNTGNVGAALPTKLAFGGQVEWLEGVRGCAVRHRELHCPPTLVAQPKVPLVLGYVRGSEVRHVP